MPTRHRALKPLPAMRARADIQGLRAIAVLLVVLGHAGVPGLAGGFVGVDVFFVVSGFLITSILLREATERGSVSLIGFYARRARRILPAATVTLAATAVAATLLLPYVRARAVLGDVAWSTAFAANVRFGNERTDYFAADEPLSPVRHFWSLAVEEQFYLVWPALLCVVLVLGARRTCAAVLRRLPWLAALVTAGVAVSLYVSVTQTADDPTGAYFSTAARSWELGAGALLAFAGRALPHLPTPVRRVFGWLGLGMVLAAALWFTEHTPVPGYHMVLPVSGTVLLLAAGSGPAPAVSRLLGRQPLRWIGDVSYGFYLWHWPLLVLAEAYAGHALSLPAKLALCAGALLAAWISYELLENPVRRARVWTLRPWTALVLWPATIGCLVLVTAGSHAYIRHERQVLAAAAANVDLSSLPTEKRMPRTGEAVHDAVADAIDRATLNAPQTPVNDLERDGAEFVRDPACRAGEPQSSHEICPLGAVGGDRTMVVLGDSHAQMWLPAFEVIAERNGYELVPITKLGCTPYEVVAWKFDRDAEYTECNAWRLWALDQVRRTDPDVVVVASASVIKSMDESTGELLPLTDSRAVWRAGIRSLAEELTALAPEVRFMADINRLPWDPADCLSDFDNTAADCTFEPSGWVADSNRLVRQGIGPTSARYVGIKGLLCLRGQCPTVVDGIAVYGDDDHLSHEYARFLTDEIEIRLRLPDRG